MRCAARKPERGRQIVCLPMALAVVLLMLAGCAVAPEPEPVVVEKEEPVVTVTVTVPEPDPVLVQGLEPEVVISMQELESEGPWDLALRADIAPPKLSTGLRLDAIDGFLELREFTHAETQANYLLDVLLSRDQGNRFNLQRGRIALGFSQFQTAIRFLQPLRNDPEWSPDERVLVLETLADAQLGLDRHVDALVNLYLRDRLLTGDGQLDSQQRILNLVEQTSTLEQALLKQSANNNGLPANLVDGWVDLAALRDLPDTERDRALIFWRNSYAGHPARDELLGGASLLHLDQFGHIALLLPFTSPFGSAAQAFHDGFMDAHHRDTGPSRPSVSLHDIGADPSLSAFYYQSAMTGGADFVVGPLGREATAALLQDAPPAMPTLVLADIPPESRSDSLYGISLSPEPETEQVAARAFADGHRQAAIFHSDSNWGRRAAGAFAEAWLNLGGTLVANRSFPDAIEEYSRAIQQFLEVNQSTVRRKVLSAQVGRNLEFNPRRRDDMDLLFLAGNAHQARLLVPQLRFFQAHDLPIYATSSIFSGKLNPAVDADLDGVIFGDMPWVVDIRYELPVPDTGPEDPLPGMAPGAGPVPPEPDAAPADEATTTGLEPAVAARQTDSETVQGEEPSAAVLEPEPEPEPQPVAKSPYGFTPLDRLYALGLETYHLIPRLSALRSEDRQNYNGQAFRASVRPDGNVFRHLEWATFENGNVVLIGAPVPVSIAPTPLAAPAALAPQSPLKE